MVSHNASKGKVKLIPRLSSSLINMIFSRRMKRMVFISSIIGLIYKEKDPDVKVISKLNEVLKLANCQHAMELPFRVKSVIWKNCDLIVLGSSGKTLRIEDVKNFDLCKEDMDRLTSQVVSQAPSWLKYNSAEVMCADLKNLFKQILKQNPSFA